MEEYDYDNIAKDRERRIDSLGRIKVEEKPRPFIQQKPVVIKDSEVASPYVQLPP
jgi:hypothetical protein